MVRQGNLEGDIKFVIKELKKEFPNLKFKKKGNVFYEEDSCQNRMTRRIRAHSTPNNSLVIRNYGGEGDSKIFNILEKLESRETLEKDYIGYEEGIQIASHFEVFYLNSA